MTLFLIISASVLLVCAAMGLVTVLTRGTFSLLRGPFEFYKDDQEGTACRFRTWFSSKTLTAFTDQGIDPNEWYPVWKDSNTCVILRASWDCRIKAELKHFKARESLRKEVEDRRKAILTNCQKALQEQAS